MLAHHVQQVVHHPKLAAVPERFTKTRVILPKQQSEFKEEFKTRYKQQSSTSQKKVGSSNLYSHRVNSAADLKASLLEHHD